MKDDTGRDGEGGRVKDETSRVGEDGLVGDETDRVRNGRSRVIKGGLVREEIYRYDDTE